MSLIFFETTQNYTRLIFKCLFSILLFILSFFVLPSISDFCVYAFSGGDGTVENPYQIANWTELDDVRNNLSSHYILMNDLDEASAGYDDLASGYAHDGDGWDPIGNSTSPFAGTFDGQNYTISGFYIYRGDTMWIGLFGIVNESGVIQNLGAVATDIFGFRLIGVLVGSNVGTINNCHTSGSVSTFNSFIGGLAGYNSGSIDNSYSDTTVIGAYQQAYGGLVGKNVGSITNSYATGDVSGQGFTGGLVGENRDGGSIDNSYASGTVSGTVDTGGSAIGGLVGNNRYASITNSYATGNVSGTHSIGGLAGFNDIYGTISNSYAVGSISGSYNIGGLVGITYGNSSIANSYAAGIVSGDSAIGGLVGRSDGGSINSSYSAGTVNGGSDSGGLVGLNNIAITNSYSASIVSGTDGVGGLTGNNATSGSVSNSYATGSVSGSTNVGGLIGTNGGSVTSSYYDSQTTGQSDTGKGEPKTTAQLQDIATFVGWDIVGTLTLPVGYPTLGFTVGNPSPWMIYSIFAGGSGTELDPYRITEWGHLHSIRTNSSTLSAHYILMNDLDENSTGYNTYASTTANGGLGWEPVGTCCFSGTDFIGSFDGQNHTISGLTINRPTTRWVGLFGYAEDAEISNVGLVGGSVAGNDYVGGLIGEGAYVTVTNCYNTGNVSGDEIVGGLFGYPWDSVISNSYATGNVSGTSYYVGGLAGYLWSSSDGLANGGTIINSYATGNVSGDTYFVGGLVAENQGFVIGSYATGNVRGYDGGTGGLVGDNDASWVAGSGSVTDSFATGNVDGDDGVGGLVGWNSSDATITRSYAAGSVNGVSDVGGLVGSNNNGAIIDSYYDSQTTGQSDTGNGEPKTTIEMRTLATFANWDIAVNTNISVGYPALGFAVSGATTIWAINPFTPPSPTPTPTSTLSSSTTGTTAGTSTASAPSCSASKPGSAPVVSSAVAGENSVTLTWSKAGNPLTHYLIAYGTVSGSIQYGNPNVGGPDTTSYTVSGLSGGTTYFFRVKAINDCMPGDYSNEVSSTAVGAAITEGPAEGFVPASELPSQLFDIALFIDEPLISSSNQLKARVTFFSFGTEPTPVDMEFIVLDASGKQLYKTNASTTIQTEGVYNQAFENLVIPNGKYTLLLRTRYNTDVEDDFKAPFEVKTQPNLLNTLCGWSKFFIPLEMIIAFLLWRRRKSKMKIRFEKT